jgi:excinuclease ABC subunit A
VGTPAKETFRKTMLHGSGRQKNRLHRDFMSAATAAPASSPSRACCRNLERRYKETESPAVREELSQYLVHSACAACEGSRLRKEAPSSCAWRTPRPARWCACPSSTPALFQRLTLTGQKGEIADKILKEIRERLHFLVNVGLDYLSLDRSAETLSGGEAQRIRLASQIGAGLMGVMYVLDEPSIGLHQRDNERLLGTLQRLRDLGNTVLVVEHDEDAIRTADYVVDIGPGAGVHGGELVAAAPLTTSSPTRKLADRRQYLSAVKKIRFRPSAAPADPEKC